MNGKLDKILNSLSRGEIDADSAARQIDRVTSERVSPDRRYLSVLVTDVFSARSKYQVRIPLEII